MATFRYQGRDKNGQEVSGEIKSENPDEVADQLLQQSITPLEIKLIKESKPLKERVNQAFQRKVPTEELILFCRQMYALMKAGVPIVNSLARVGDTTSSPQLASAVKGAGELISEGQTLTAALSMYPKIFNHVFVSIIDAGENAGQLEGAFSQLISYLELESKTVKQLKSTMRYPIIVIIAVTIAIFVINFVVVPSFAEMFAHFDTELPLPTRIIIAMSKFMTHNWIYIVVLLLAVGIGIYFLLKKPEVRVKWDYWKLHMPVFGSILERIILARFARIFSMIIQTGVPIVEGINLVARTVGNAYTSQNITQMSTMLEQGESLTRAAAETQMFTPLVIQMLHVGEEAGTTDEMLTHVAEFYEQEIDYDLSRLNQLIEPIILVLLGAMVLVIALGVFLPLWEMVSFVK